MPRVLRKKFFERPVLEVAKGLIGASLVRQLPDGSTISSLLTEVEAYDGPEDLASHASKGRTPRTDVMFGPAGVFYVYLIYGMHLMLNVVTGEAGYPAAVLIRGTRDISGPGRLTARLQIDKSLNGKHAKKSSGLWFEDRSIVIPDQQIASTPRIGVEYSGEWSRAPYRFVLRESEFVISH
jgi:DNA-3-methyladenine glycosylase